MKLRAVSVLSTGASTVTLLSRRGASKLHAARRTTTTTATRTQDRRATTRPALTARSCATSARVLLPGSDSRGACRLRCEQLPKRSDRSHRVNRRVPLLGQDLVLDDEPR